MLHGGVHLNFGIPANDNPCVVHQLEWPARAKIALDTSEFVFRSGTVWSPHVLKLGAARFEGTEAASRLPASLLDEAAPDFIRDVPAVDALGSEPGWAKRAGWSGQRDLLLGAALIGLGFVFHGQRAWTPDASANQFEAATGSGVSPHAPLAPRPWNEIETAQRETIIEAAAGATGSGSGISPGAVQTPGDPAARAEPEQPAAPPPPQPVTRETAELAGDAGMVDPPPWNTGAASQKDASAAAGGSRQPQSVVGTSSSDHLTGGIGNDTLLGGEGDDVLDGGEGADLMVGGAGNDVFVVDDLRDQVVEEADEGNDTIVVLAKSAEAYSLRTLDNVENLVVRASGKFTAEGNDLANVVIVIAGDSALSGGAGNDALYSSAGNDRIDGGTGADLMVGRRGDDIYAVDDVDDLIVEQRDQGCDTVETTLSEYGLDVDVENLVYVGNVDFIGYGNDGANAIWGGDGNDWLYGEYQVGLVGQAPIPASDAVSESPAVEPPASSPTDEAQLDLTNDAVVEAVLEELLGASQAVIVMAVLEAPEAAQIDSVVVGSRSNDDLSGIGGSNDVIDGGRGHDVIEGGRGDDVLTGGSGHDTFVFYAGFGNDTITDFTADGGDRDEIVFSADLFADFDALEPYIEQVGADVVIQVTATDRITLLNFDKINLSANDHFDFH